jgi:hypothetical protein
MKSITTSISFLYIGTIFFAHVNAEKRNIRGLIDIVADNESETPITVDVVDEANAHITEGEELLHDDMAQQIHTEFVKEEDKKENDLEQEQGVVHVEDSRQLGYNTGTISSIDIVGKGTTPAVPVVVYEKEGRPQYGSYSGNYYGSYYGKGKGKGGRYGYGGGYYDNYYGSYYGSYYGNGKGKGGRYYYRGGQREKVVDTIVKEVVEVGKGAW